VQLHWLLPIVLITAKLFGVLSAPGQGEDGDPLFGLAQIGLCVLLFRVGLETELENTRRVVGPAALLATAGMVFPLVLGTVSSLAVGIPTLPAMFIGATLTATSIGVTASVLDELGASSSRAATLILGAAVIDDVLALVVLAALVGSTTAQGSVGVEIGLAILQAVAFLGGALWLGRPLAQATVRLTRWTRSRSTLFVLVFSALLLTASAAKVAGLEMIIGAYAAGLALGRHPEREWLERELEPLIELFTPIFFVLVGSAIAFETLAIDNPEGRFTLALALILFVVAVAGKLLAPFTVRSLEGPKLALGSALVPRGEVGLIFAQVGLAQGVLTADLFAALALAITGTTLAGPVLLRKLWPRDDPTPR
jgi:Kef-type K+ transport system membrane component KefB